MKVPFNPRVALKPTPSEQVAAKDGATFFNRLAMAMKDNPPNAPDGRALWKLRKLGVEPGKLFDIGKVDPAIARGLNRAVKEALARMNDGLTTMSNVNGWIRLPDLGRCGTNYGARAGIARVGLGADLRPDDADAASRVGDRAALAGFLAISASSTFTINTNPAETGVSPTASSREATLMSDMAWVTILCASPLIGGRDGGSY